LFDFVAKSIRLADANNSYHHQDQETEPNNFFVSH